jgi:LPXTG-motif cell wall-anchored protein
MGRNTMRKTALTLLTVALVLSPVPAAFAQTSPGDDCEVIDVYTTTCPTIEGTIVETTSPGVEIPTVVEGTKTVTGTTGGTTGGATLPMTGAELSGLVLAGVVLVGGGTTLVVAGRRRKHPSD